MLKRTTTMTLFLAAVLWAPNGFAQDAPAEPAPEATEAPAEAAEAAEATEATETPVAEAETPAEPEETAEVPDDVDPTATADADVEADTAEESSNDELDPNDPLYWSKLRDIYTVQKRAFQKQGRFAVTVYGGLIPNNAFEKYVPLGARINYYILENLGLELAGSYALKFDTSLERVLREETGAGAQQVLVGDTQLAHVNFGVVWSPFYGKAAFYSSALNYFDLYLFAGAGMVVTETQPDFNAPAEQDFKPEGALGAGLAFYVGSNASVRLDFRQFVFQKVEGVGGVANPSEVSLGFGWFF